MSNTGEEEEEEVLFASSSSSSSSGRVDKARKLATVSKLSIKRSNRCGSSFEMASATSFGRYSFATSRHVCASVVFAAACVACAAVFAVDVVISSSSSSSFFTRA